MATPVLLPASSGSRPTWGDPEEPNMKSITCRDVGVDCDYAATGETVEEVLQKCGEHARSEHGMTEIPAELADKVKAAIRDEPEQKIA
jgi:predicted small metal-binding protein